MEWYPQEQLHGARALLNSERARARIVELRANPGLFTDPTMRELARCCIQGHVCEQSIPVLRRSPYPDWYESLADPMPDDDGWAVDAINLLASMQEEAWLAPTLDWGAEAIRRGESPTVVLAELQRAFSNAGIRSVVAA